MPRQLILARLAVLPFFLLGLWVTWHWSSELYGRCAGSLATMMFGLSPDILTHSAVVAPDFPATSTGLLVGYCYWRWLTKPGTRGLPLDVALATALAILCKFTWLLLFALLPLATTVNDLAQRRARPFRDTMRLSLSLLIALLVINVNYGFDGTGKRLGEFEFISQAFSGGELSRGTTGNRFAGHALQSLPVPLPAEMVRGIDFLKWEFEHGYPCYMNGHWAQRGWWYFYLYAVAVKMPVGYWLLILAGCASWGCDRVCKRSTIAGEWIPLVFMLAFLATVSSQTGFTHHVRYVLPCYGMLFIMASRTALRLTVRSSLVAGAVGLAGVLCFHITHFGYAHTFFNAVAGGPAAGWKHLTFSNVDWGQSTYRMLHWTQANPDKRPLVFLGGAMASTPVESLPVGPDVYFDRNQVSSNRSEVHWVVLSTMHLSCPWCEDLQPQTPHSQPHPDVLVYRIPGRQANTTSKAK